jgi:hypothetical protein
MSRDLRGWAQSDPDPQRQRRLNELADLSQSFAVMQSQPERQTEA